MKKNKQQKPLNEGWVMAQQIVKDGKGQERIVNKPIPEHLSKKPKLMKRMNIILEGEQAFISKEQIEQEKSEYRVWAESIDKLEILEGLLPIEKTAFKIDILNDRIKQLSKKETKPKKDDVKKEETIKAE